MNGIIQKLRLNREQKPFVAIIAAFMIVYLVLGWFIDQKRSIITYYVSQWMITFAAGFIRRGLLGQAIWDLSSITHIAPVEIIKCCQYLLGAAMAVTLGWQCFKNRSWLGIPGLCILLANPFLTKYIWLETGSSDLFFILLPFANLWLTKLEEERYTFYATVLMATAGVFIALTHEAFLFLCLPINLSISWRYLKEDRFQSLITIYAAPIFACLIEGVYHGTPNQANIINAAWKSAGVKIPTNSAIHYLSFNISEELYFVRGVLRVSTVLVWILATILCLAPLLYIARSLVSDRKFRQRLWDFLAFPFLCTIPMYVLGSDWDRWPSITVSAGVGCLLLLARQEFTLPHLTIKKWIWVPIVIGSLLIRPVTPNVTIGAVFTGPIDIIPKLAFHRRV